MNINKIDSKMGELMPNILSQQQGFRDQIKDLTTKTATEVKDMQVTQLDLSTKLTNHKYHPLHIYLGMR